MTLSLIIITNLIVLGIWSITCFIVGAHMHEQRKINEQLGDNLKLHKQQTESLMLQLKQHDNRLKSLEKNKRRGE